MIGRRHMRTPFSSDSAKLVLGAIESCWSEQATAASATLKMTRGAPHTHAGDIVRALVTTAMVPGAGESMTVMLTKNGANILSGVFTINAASFPAGRRKVQIPPELFLDKSVKPGDVLAVVRVYTAGGTPAPIADNVVTLLVG